MGNYDSIWPALRLAKIRLRDMEDAHTQSLQQLEQAYDTIVYLKKKLDSLGGVVTELTQAQEDVKIVFQDYDEEKEDLEKRVVEEVPRKLQSVREEKRALPSARPVIETARQRHRYDQHSRTPGPWLQRSRLAMVLPASQYNTRKRTTMGNDAETELHNSQIRRNQDDRSRITRARRSLPKSRLFLHSLQAQLNGHLVSYVVDGEMEYWAPMRFTELA